MKTIKHELKLFLMSLWHDHEPMIEAIQRH